MMLVKKYLKSNQYYEIDSNGDEGVGSLIFGHTSSGNI